MGLDAESVRAIHLERRENCTGRIEDSSSHALSNITSDASSFFNAVTARSRSDGLIGGRYVVCVSFAFGDSEFVQVDASYLRVCECAFKARNAWPVLNSASRSCLVSVSRFQPVSSVAGVNSPLTIVGEELDLESLQSVHLVLGPSCDILPVSGSSFPMSQISSQAMDTEIVLTPVATIPAGEYSVCVEFVSNATIEAFVKVGTSQYLVGESV